MYGIDVVRVMVVPNGADTPGQHQAGRGIRTEVVAFHTLSTTGCTGRRRRAAASVVNTVVPEVAQAQYIVVDSAAGA